VSRSIKTPSLKIYLSEEFQKKEEVVTQVGGQIEYTTLAHVVSNSSIHYDPDPKRTLIAKDADLVALYNDFYSGEDQTDRHPSPWVLRLELDQEKMVQKDLSINQIDRTLHSIFMEEIKIQHSDDNSENLVMRLRFDNLEEEDDDEETAAQKMNQVKETLLQDLTIKGFNSILKVYFTK
jgi:DNA-directed RNA polymerase II subunit RPB1